MGLMNSEEENIPEALSDSVYFAVWSNFQLLGRTSRKDVVSTLIPSSSDDVPPSVIREASRQSCDDGALTDEEIHEIAERRFGKSLPLDCINLIVLMEMH